ncbi:hypothetical protein [Vibrio mediterranei]|uniref:hypothetical protein n=1 Tax=Vibrio mediterranei TaxID=689 RepID=UPI004068A09F
MDALLDTFGSKTYSIKIKIFIKVECWLLYDDSHVETVLTHRNKVKVALLPLRIDKVVANASLKENAIRLDFLPKIIAYSSLAMRQTLSV